MATPEDIERKLICSICLHVLADPKLLTCGHTYCLSCLHTHICQPETPQIENSTLGFKCPICREFIPAPNSTSPPLDWASQCRTNYIVQELLDVHRDKRRRNPSCAEHPGKVLELFCRDCNTPACDRCVSLDHRACSEVVELCTVVKERQNRTAQQILQVNAMLAQCERKRKRCETGSAVLDRIEYDVGQNIDRECRDVIQKMAAHMFMESERLKAEVRTHCDEGRSVVRGYVSKCTELMAILERMRTYLLAKSNEATISSPVNKEDERRVANTLNKLSQAVDAIDNPCHFEVRLYLDDLALTQALRDFRLGEVAVFQMADNGQFVRKDGFASSKPVVDLNHENEDTQTENSACNSHENKPSDRNYISAKNSHLLNGHSRNQNSEESSYGERRDSTTSLSSSSELCTTTIVQSSASLIHSHSSSSSHFSTASSSSTLLRKSPNLDTAISIIPLVKTTFSENAVTNLEDRVCVHNTAQVDGTSKSSTSQTQCCSVGQPVVNTDPMIYHPLADDSSDPESCLDDDDGGNVPVAVR